MVKSVVVQHDSAYNCVLCFCVLWISSRSEFWRTMHCCEKINSGCLRCGFEGRSEIVCCPNTAIPAPPTSGSQPNNRAPLPSNPASSSSNGDTLSQRKCKEYQEAIYEYIYSISLDLNAKKNRIKVDKCGHKTVPLIVGGEFAKLREFPHMALLGYEQTDGSTAWSCGGTLISDQYVLTAGHCLRTRRGPPKYILLGELDILSDTDGVKPETFSVANIIPHPDYKTTSKYNDIGLVKMDKKVNLTPFIRPACLPTEFGGPETQAIATGWGDKEWNSKKGSSQLLKVTLTKFTHRDCNKTYETEISTRLEDGIREETQICAGSKTKREDTCQGDSGGPLQVYSSLYCMYTIIGVTSFGITCGEVNVPGVYTRVYPYVSWIENQVWRNE
ncbi:unnamed protein product [Hermetia illucens]|uniref:Peptidase S1 domain-containing protein n=1 Tax=Hermetia illucens TaxID=343691 RepID=A0A7R8V768_HERIL|nr:unnamed protein product [Hermetia illucens]